MNVSSNNPEYKVISLLIKIAIFIFSFWFIYHKLKTTSLQFNSTEVFEHGNGLLLFLTFGLMFLNWGLEALKWKFLIRPLEVISFKTSLRSVFSGVTVSIFMPNRVGEFAGRIFFLQKADKIEATLKNFIGSLIQLCLTVFFGTIAILIFIRKGFNKSINVDLFNFFDLRIAFIIAFVFLTLLFFLNRHRSRFSEKMRIYFSTVFDIPKKDLVIVLLISFLRYFVFLFQYYLVLRAFNIRPDFMTAVILIAITFFITSVVPSFALTEIATRGAAAVFLFNVITDNSAAILSASFIVWLINLAFPALIGTAFIWKLKFFK